MNTNAIPVLYYHSVKYKINTNWVHPQIIMKLSSFIKHIKLFSSLNLNTFFLDDVLDHLAGIKQLPVNSLVLTFDDGYLDNYVFVFPLLKKYKLKATIWVAPDFVDNSDSTVRPTLEDYWNNKITLDELNNFDGYINWAEMKLMQDSGLIDIQSHTLTHTRFPVSTKIIDFINPYSKIDWLYWNLFREDKPFFLTRPQHTIPLGYPIYENQPSNTTYITKEDGSLTAELTEYVRKHGGKLFFDDPAWKDKLFSISEDIQNNSKDLYCKESDEEHTKRVKTELTLSRELIEKNLGKNVKHVCWPFGSWNEKAENIALNSGYLTNTIRGQKNIFNKTLFNRVDRIALDNPKYQYSLFYPYALFKLLHYKF